MSLQRTLDGRKTRLARIEFDGVPQRARQALENRLHDVVGIASVSKLHVEIDTRVLRNRL